MANLNFRKVEAADFDLLLSFFMKNDRQEVTQFFHPFSLDRKSVTRIIEDSNVDRFYIGVSENSVVVFAMLRGWKEGYVTPSLGMLVDHDNVGRGIGKRMLSHVIADASQNGCMAIRLTVHKANLAALGLYKGFGFKVIRDLPNESESNPKVEMRLDLVSNE